MLRKNAPSTSQLTTELMFPNNLSNIPVNSTAHRDLSYSDEQTALKSLSDAIVREDETEIINIMTAHAWLAKAVNHRGHTPLMNMIDRGKTNLAIVMARLGSDPHLDRANGVNPLIRHAIKRKQAALIPELVKAGADINGKDYDTGETALHLGVGQKDLATVEAILTCPGVAVNEPRDDGNTPLLNAVKLDDREIVQRLLEHPDIDANQPDRDGFTPLILATQSRNMRSSELLINSDYPNSILGRLLAHSKIKVNLGTKSGFTALHSLALNNNAAAMKRLLSHENTEPNLLDNDGRTPLMITARYGHIDCAKLLLKHHECDINQADPYGATAVVLAAINNHLELVKLLIEHSHYVSEKHHQHVASLWMAVIEGQTEIIKALELYDVGKEGIFVPDQFERHLFMLLASIGYIFRLEQSGETEPFIYDEEVNNNIIYMEKLARSLPQIVLEDMLDEIRKSNAIPHKGRVLNILKLAIAGKYGNSNKADNTMLTFKALLTEGRHEHTREWKNMVDKLAFTVARVMARWPQKRNARVGNNVQNKNNFMGRKIERNGK
jgi:ankyrin repeat protein